jgi:hypothetical protein
MNNAEFIHKKYSDLSNNNFIASKLALLELQKVLDMNKFEHSLELGGGIGTITELLLLNGVRVSTYEDNLMCLHRLYNLRLSSENKLDVYSELSDLLLLDAIDLLIIDYPINYVTLKKIITKNRNTISVIAIEGNRFYSRIHVIFSMIKLKLNFESVNFASLDNETEGIWFVNVNRRIDFSYFKSLGILSKVLPRFIRLEIRYLISRHALLKFLYSRLKNFTRLVLRK